MIFTRYWFYVMRKVVWLAMKHGARTSTHMITVSMSMSGFIDGWHQTGGVAF
jgi:hypothetical protein